VLLIRMCMQNLSAHRPNLASVLKQVHSVRQLIYTGSYAVYGDREGAWVDEASPVAPPTRMVKILCETEQVLLSASSDDMSVCILRLGGIYGPRRELVKYLVEWLVQFVPVTVRMQQLDPP